MKGQVNMLGFSQILLHNIYELNTADKIAILAKLCSTEVINMFRLLQDHQRQHSTPGVLPYDQIESVTLVDVK